MSGGELIRRTVFVVSDRTGITAETMCHSLLSQFPGIRFETVALPYTDTDDKINAAIAQIEDCRSQTGVAPLVFSTMVDDALRSRLDAAGCNHLDLFGTFIDPLEQALGVHSSHSVGRAHGVVDPGRYTSRISAVNYSVHCDDGLHPADYDSAAVILLGVSRTGKTPTCLYLALHFGVFAANFPLTEDDLAGPGLPAPVRGHRNKLFGLTIDPERLRQIRHERRANSRYASLEQCRTELRMAESLYQYTRVPYVDTTSMSIEEIATTVLQRLRIRRDHY